MSRWFEASNATANGRDELVSVFFFRILLLFRAIYPNWCARGGTAESPRGQHTHSIHIRTCVTDAVERVNSTGRDGHARISSFGIHSRRTRCTTTATTAAAEKKQFLRAFFFILWVCMCVLCVVVVCCGVALNHSTVVSERIGGMFMNCMSGTCHSWLNRGVFFYMNIFVFVCSHSSVCEYMAMTCTLWKRRSLASFHQLIKTWFLRVSMRHMKMLIDIRYPQMAHIEASNEWDILKPPYRVKYPRSAKRIHAMKLHASLFVSAVVVSICLSVIERESDWQKKKSAPFLAHYKKIWCHRIHWCSKTRVDDGLMVRIAMVWWPVENAFIDRNKEKEKTTNCWYSLVTDSCNN